MKRKYELYEYLKQQGEVIITTCSELAGIMKTGKSKISEWLRELQAENMILLDSTGRRTTITVIDTVVEEVVVAEEYKPKPNVTVIEVEFEEVI